MENITGDNVVDLYREYKVRREVINSLITLSDSVPEEYQWLRNRLMSLASEIYRKGIK